MVLVYAEGWEDLKGHHSGSEEDAEFMDQAFGNLGEYADFMSFTSACLITVIFNNDGPGAFPLLLWLYICPNIKIQPPGKSGVSWKLEMIKILKKNDFIQHAVLSFYKGAEFQGLRKQWLPQEIITLLLGADIFKGEPRQQKDE